jgi:hypothetical protein
VIIEKENARQNEKEEHHRHMLHEADLERLIVKSCDDKKLPSNTDDRLKNIAEDKFPVSVLLTQPTRGRKWSIFIDLTSTLVSGVGVMLHFRWQCAIMAWAFAGMVLFGIVGIIYYGSCFGLHKVNSRRSYDACESNVKFQVDSFNQMEIAYFICNCILYIGTFFFLLVVCRKAA